jgi:hypothetical protein
MYLSRPGGGTMMGMNSILDASLGDVCDGLAAAFTLRAKRLVDPYRTEEEDNEIAILDLLLEEWWSELRRRIALAEAIRDLRWGRVGIG